MKPNQEKDTIAPVIFIGAFLLGTFTKFLGLNLICGLFYFIAGLSGMWWVFRKLEK